MHLFTREVEAHLVSDIVILDNSAYYFIYDFWGAISTQVTLSKFQLPL